MPSSLVRGYPDGCRAAFKPCVGHPETVPGENPTVRLRGTGVPARSDRVGAAD
ncbi:hypothetical protein FHR33_001710 [Nonomuraea dietziae]|uniref:Uncharacterized protein n=1 Tax=Nonomuraea dietziae TaxID=65515 RepID=A0A7W5V6L5_9ACTN|nr:hypothetical protein [Nonomuraea dietziae]